MLIKNNKNGFTLFETMLSIGILGSVSVAALQYSADQIEKSKIQNFVKNINDVVNAVDARIAIDGYDPDLWNKLSWNDESDIIDNLVKKDLQTNSNCTGGSWTPSVNAESSTVLLPCNFSLSANKMDFEINSKIENDSAGFIQKFEIVTNFKSQESFQKNLINLRTAMRDIDTYEKRERSGSHSMYFVNKNDTNDEITSFECINDLTNCSFKAVFDRSGGNEYLRADGANSMIGEHITFIESKGQSPMKCIRWANTDRSGTGVWTQTLDEDCGIGIYKNDPHPVMLDVVADTGTFKNILLDKECNLYAWNGSNVVDTGGTSPCGINNTTGDVYQVVKNATSYRIDTVDIYSDNSSSNKADFAIANIGDLIAQTIKVNTIDVLNELKTDLIKSYATNNVTFDSNVTINDILIAGNNVNIAGDTYGEGEAYFRGNIISENSLISNKSIQIKEVNTENSSCPINGSLSVTADGGLLNCVSGIWNLAIKDSTPIGTVAMWASYSIPSGWIEMNGQSTSPYPKLQAIVGNNVPDMRGVVARGLDNGRGLDSGRSLGSYQVDTDQQWTSQFRSFDRGSAAGLSGIAVVSGRWSASVRGGNSDSWGSYINMTNSTQNRTANESRMKNVSLIYIIKAS